MKNESRREQESGAKFVAFLRGINVGGNKMVKMEELKKSFTALGFENVKTVLASGNVIFETAKPGPNDQARIEAKLKSDLGHEIGVQLRPIEELRRLAELDPFKKIKVTPQTRLYVTFLSEKRKGNLKIPHESPKGDLKILHASEKAVCSAIVLSPGQGTIELMAFLEREFGKRVTTRNWNTIAKILKG